MSRLYLYFFEDGTIELRREMSEADKHSCDAGFLSVIDVTGCDTPMDYHDGKWTAIQVAK